MFLVLDPAKEGCSSNGDYVCILNFCIAPVSEKLSKIFDDLILPQQLVNKYSNELIKPVEHDLHIIFGRAQTFSSLILRQQKTR